MLVQKLNNEELENLGLIRREHSLYEGSSPWMVHLKEEQDKKRMICTRSGLSHHDFFNSQSKDKRMINTCLRSFVLKEHVDLKMNDVIQMYQFDVNKNIFNFKEHIYTEDKKLDSFFREQFIIGEEQSLEKMFKTKKTFNIYFKNMIYYFVRMEESKLLLKNILSKNNIVYTYNQENFFVSYNKFIDFIFSDIDSLSYKDEQEAGDFLFCFLFFGEQRLFSLDDSIEIKNGKIIIENINNLKNKLNKKRD